MHTHKISKAVTSALAYLEDAINLHVELSEVIMLVWNAASDLEYALFLFSLIDPETRNSSWRLQQSKQAEIESLLASTRKLLQDASEGLRADNLEEAHRKIWLARGQLLKIHDSYDKD